MAKVENGPPRPRGAVPQASPDSLRVLIIGGAEAKNLSGEILNTFILLGYGVKLLAVLDLSFTKCEGEELSEEPAEIIARIHDLMMVEPADVIIITCDNVLFRRKLSEAVPTTTRILDAFALKMIRDVRDLLLPAQRQAGKIDYVELMKEVLMSGPETSTMVVDENFRIRDINNAILSKTGLTREECLNQPCYRLLRNRLRPCRHYGDSCVAWQVQETGKAAHSVLEDHKHPTKERYFTVSAYPLHDDGRAGTQSLVVWKDVTKGIAPVLDRQAQHMRENFSYMLRQDKMVALGKLATAAVHEINNPIQGILTFAKLMRSSMDGDEISPAQVEQFRTYLDLIATESARCGKILRNLLSFARRNDLRTTDVDLPKLIEEIFLLVRHRMHLQGVAFERELQEGLPDVMADRDQIKQALLNILLNALEAMPHGGEITLAAKAQPKGDQVIIAVSDTGPGIPAEHREHIFEPFYTTKDEGKGVGLGLSVVYGIITQHGGDIEVESAEGGGTSFLITLPASKNDRTAEDRSIGNDVR